MRQQIVSVTGASTSSTIIPMNLNTNPFNVGFGAVATGAGTTSYSIQHTFDNPWSVANPTWFFHPSTPSGTPVTANLDGNYAFPVAAIKILTSASNSNTITLTVNQAGIA
jgi:hypothetical protein